MKPALLLVLTVGLFALQGCKKDDNPDASLTGSWEMTAYGTDVNKNGAIDASERKTLDSGEYAYLNITQSFITDSFLIDGSGISFSFLYTRQGNQIYLSGLVGSEPYAVIKTLNPTSLDIGTGDTTGELWRFYTRQ
ncbi:MAG: hypothetical protein EOP52_05125 [Sphingobacteriales bacterium]|nr:MAG: hypothetical protein EOP52_05125 [Sphingobacteriales bacterium]